MMKPKKEATVWDLLSELNVSELGIHNPKAYNDLMDKIRNMEKEIDNLSFELYQEQMRTDRAKERVIKLLFEEEDDE